MPPRLFAVLNALLCGCLLLMAFPAAAQMVGKDLDAATVRARRLSLENLLDSVIKHAPQSYSEPQSLAVVEKTMLYSGNDTPFKTIIPAYLVKGNSFTYALKRDTTESVLVEDHLPEGGYERILTLSAFPEGTNLLNLLESAAEESVTQKGFYATSGWGDSLRYHVIVPQSYKRGMLLRLFTTQMDDDTILAFESYTIRRKGWVLEEKAWKATSAPRELVKIFRKTKSYRQADSLMEAARAKEDVPQAFSIKRWTEGPDGRYVFSDYILRDNLMFFSGTRNTKDFLRSYVYRYETHRVAIRQPEDPEKLRSFSAEKFFKTKAPRGLKASFSDRN